MLNLLSTVLHGAMFGVGIKCSVECRWGVGPVLSVEDWQSYMVDLKQHAVYVGTLLLLTLQNS